MVNSKAFARANLCLSFLISVEVFVRRCSVAFTPKSKRRESRYFAENHLLPPLSRFNAMVSSNATSVCSDLVSESSSFDLPVLYTNDPQKVGHWLRDNVPCTGCTLGFDVESIADSPWLLGKASFRGPATVQLSTPESSLVVQLARRSRRPSRACVPILEAVFGDEKIIKAGVAIDQDMLELRQAWGIDFEAKSRMELGGIGVSPKDRGHTSGLKSLSRSVLGIDLPKPRRIAVSDWSRVPLTPSQLAYSARDAWVAAAVVEKLATHEPETFGTMALIERLRSQTRLGELHQRWIRRKQAKVLLSALNVPFVPSKQNYRQHGLKSKRPNWKVKACKNLKDVVRNNGAEEREVFDINSFDP